MATSESYIEDLRANWSSQLENLSLKPTEREIVYEWIQMPNCTEFVGSKIMNLLRNQQKRKLNKLKEKWIEQCLHIHGGRSKHTVVGYEGAIYVFGGDNGKSMLNDLLRYDVKEQSWGRTTTGSSQQVPPSPRYHHSAVVYESSMFVFGGYTGDIHSNSNLANKNDLYEYKFKTGQWIQWLHKGRAPVPRSAHGAAVFDGKMYIFAGYDGNARLNDMWTVSLKDRIPLNDNCEMFVSNWEQVHQHGDRPPTCCNFPVAVARDCMFVFSGQSGARFSNELYQFDFRSLTWTRISTRHLLRATAPWPTRRYGHTMVAHSRHLYVFGGVADNTLPNEVHRFDLDTLQWSLVPSTHDSEPPRGRLFHAAAALDGVMYVYGGTIESTGRSGPVDCTVRSGEMFKFKLSNFPRCTLHDDFGKLQASGDFSDLEFVVGQEEKRMKVHAAIVSVRSNVLLEMVRAAQFLQKVKTDTTEQNEGASKPMLQIKFKDEDPEIFEMILHYIYSDRIDPTRRAKNVDEDTFPTVMEIYRLAQKLEMTPLENMCLANLQYQINESNVIPALQYATKLELTSIKYLCFGHILNPGSYKKVIMSKEFESLDKDLILEVMREKEHLASHYDRPFARNARYQNDINLLRGLGSFPGETYGYPRPFNHPTSDDTPDDTLKDDMKLMLNHPEFSDVTLLVKDKPTFAHKAILAARSGYFEALFRSNKDMKTVQISIGDIYPTRSAFRSLMKFIYCGKTRMQPEDSVYLYSASHFYCMSNNRLQAFCKDNLERNVTSNNMLEVLEAAVHIHSTEMKEFALALVVQNFAQISKMPKIRGLSRELLVDILEALAKNIGESTAKLKVQICQDLLSSQPDPP